MLGHFHGLDNFKILKHFLNVNYVNNYCCMATAVWLWWSQYFAKFSLSPEISEGFRIYLLKHFTLEAIKYMAV